ncbi:helix-turn-helix transcriptional regulator [Mesorhizobium sp. L-8-10]|uniref:helix-turn-helix transcriptional regulator n=1 Tax=Mesorhizobium sp. L-8-10 TaxID=2744523 RepID=UPI001925F9E3|nr:hypothetical protein [Mesorhizobium sp. L-8-10]
MGFSPAWGWCGVVDEITAWNFGRAKLGIVPLASPIQIELRTLELARSRARRGISIFMSAIGLKASKSDRRTEFALVWSQAFTRRPYHGCSSTGRDNGDGEQNGAMDDCDRLIRKIYEAAVNPDYWSPLGIEIADFVGGGTVHLLLASADGGDEYFSLFPRGDPGFASEYLRDYVDTDFRVPRILKNDPGVLLDERSYVSREEARRSPIHQELLPKYAIYDIIGAHMSVDGCIGWFGVSTLKPGDDLDPVRKAALARLTPHVLQAYKTTKANRDLQISRDMSLGVLDRLNTAVIVVRGRKFMHANHAAAQILDTGFLLVDNGRLVCPDTVENNRLAQFQERIRTTGRSHVIVHDQRIDVDYSIRAHASAPSFGADGKLRSAEIVFSISELGRGGEADVETVALFCADRNVTNAETAVLCAVLNSRNLRELAAERGVALDTVQKQLKSALEKLGFANQKTLFREFARFRTLG